MDKLKDRLTQAQAVREAIMGPARAEYEETVRKVRDVFLATRREARRKLEETHIKVKADYQRAMAQPSGTQESALEVVA